MPGLAEPDLALPEEESMGEEPDATEDEVEQLAFRPRVLGLDSSVQIVHYLHGCSNNRVGGGDPNPMYPFG